jgi:hypothetical protein
MVLTVTRSRPVRQDDYEAQRLIRRRVATPDQVLAPPLAG